MFSNEALPEPRSGTWTLIYRVAYGQLAEKTPDDANDVTQGCT